MARMDEKFLNHRSRIGHLTQDVRPTAYKTYRNDAHVIGILFQHNELERTSMRAEMSVAEAKSLLEQLKRMVDAATCLEQQNRIC